MKRGKCHEKRANLGESLARFLYEDKFCLECEFLNKNNKYSCLLPCQKKKREPITSDVNGDFF